MDKSDTDSSVISDSLLWDLQMELCPQMVFFLNSDHTVKHISKSALRYFSAKKIEQIIGCSIFSVLENPVLLLLVKKWFARLESGKPVDEYIPLDTYKTGRYEWYHVQGSLAQRDGVVYGSVFFIDDVTELYSQRRVVDTLMASIPGTILVFDRSLRVILGSDSLAVENGFQSWRELVGKNLTDLKTIDVPALELLIDRMILGEDVITEVTPLTDEEHGEQWFFIDLRTVNSAAGTFGYMLTTMNMTGEIKAKVVLESLMDASSDALVIVNPDGRIEYASQSLAQSLKFRNWRELVGNPWNLLFQNVSPRGIGDATSDDFAGRFVERKNGTIWLPDEDGERCFNYKVDQLAYKDKNLGFLTVATDITELDAARVAAEDAVRAKAAFLANMSHELRTPMNAVLGMNELLSRTVLSPEQQNYITHIRSSAAMLLGIINDILDFSKMEAGSLSLNRSPWRFESLLTDVVNLVRVKAHEKELSLTVNLEPDIPSVMIGDEIRIKQILINLLNNAVKFTEQGSVSLSIHVETAGTGHVRLIMSVADTGIGIPRDKQHLLFSRFTRFDGAVDRGIEGSGLGLSICYNLARMMAGSIRLDSADGAGSVFTAEISQDVEPGTPPVSVIPSTGSVRLLVYDRDPAILDSIRRMAAWLDSGVTVCTDLDQLRFHLSQKNAYTHCLVEFKGGYDCVCECRRPDSTMRTLALMSLSDLTDGERLVDIDCLFKPLMLPVFLDWIGGRTVDFAGTLNESKSVVSGNQLDNLRAPDARILVVDDSTVNRKVALGFLQTFEIQVDEAEDGFDALEQLAVGSYDLVFMDHRMPGIDGIETTRRLRAMGGRNAQVPVVALTANSPESYEQAYLDVGICDHLFKPVGYNAFQSCLRRWLPEECWKKGGEENPAAETAVVGSTDAGIVITSAANAKSPDEKTAAWIPGLDKQQGIMYTGSEKNLEMILGVFARSGPKMLDRVEQGRAGGDREAFRTAVHALISSIANIGGTQIPRHARELEQAITADNTAIIDRLFPVVRDELEHLIDAVSGYLDAKKE